MKKLLIVLAIVAAGLIATIGARGSECLSPSDSCLPGTEPGEMPEAPHRLYLPLVVDESKSSPPIPLTCDVAEVENNDTHIDAQAMLSTCVAGNASWAGDADWYRLEVCSPVDLRLVLEGPEDADLDLYLYDDPPGWPLYSSETVDSSNELIMAANVHTGTYYAMIQPVLGQGDYVLDVGVTRSKSDER